LERRVDLGVSARAGGGSTEVGQRVRKAERGTSRGERDFASRQSAERADCRSFVRRHLGLNQVRNCDSRDDQNDRHDDQQFDKRETLLLLLHTISLRIQLYPSTPKSSASRKPKSNFGLAH